MNGPAGPLGKTPLQLELPRSQEAIALTFTKPGFAALALKVVPHQDKDILASLQRAGGRPALAAGAIPGAASQTKTVRVTTTTTSRSERTVATPAAITRGPPPPPIHAVRRRPAPALIDVPTMTDRKSPDAPEEDFAAMFAASEKAAAARAAAKLALGDRVRGKIVSIGQEVTVLELAGGGEGTLETLELLDELDS